MSILNKMSVLIVSLTVAGYPLVGVLTGIFGVESTLGSIPFRLMMALLSLMVIALGFSRGIQRKIFPLYLFAGMYVLRLVWDIFVAGVPGAVDALTFFVATTMLPIFALGFVNINEDCLAEIASIIFCIGGVATALADLSVFLNLSSYQTFAEHAGRLGFDAIDPISLGHVGVSTILCVIILKKKPSFSLGFFFSVFCLVSAGTCIVLTASKGPFVALALCILVYAIKTKRVAWFLLIVLSILPFVAGKDIAILNRFSRIEDDASSLERLTVMADAIDQFRNHYFFGNAFVETESLEYPHNIFIETAMALGLVGLVVLLILVKRAFGRVVKHFSDNRLFYPLLFTQYFVSSQFSGGIFSDSALWVIMSILLVKESEELPQQENYLEHELSIVGKI